MCKGTGKSQSESRKNRLNTMFELGCILSSGMIGIVYLARDKIIDFNLCLNVIKIMFKSKIIEKDLVHSISNEIEMLLKVRSIPGCINLIRCINEEEYLALVFPFYPHGDLYRYSQKRNQSKRNPLTEDEIRFIIH